MDIAAFIDKYGVWVGLLIVAVLVFWDKRDDVLAFFSASYKARFNGKRQAQAYEQGRQENATVYNRQLVERLLDQGAQDREERQALSTNYVELARNVETVTEQTMGIMASYVEVMRQMTNSIDAALAKIEEDRAERRRTIEEGHEIQAALLLAVKRMEWPARPDGSESGEGE